MKQNEEKLVNAMQACAALGIGGTMISALKRAMGIRSRYFFLSDVRRFMRKNPNFTISQIYRPSSKPHKSDPTMKTSPQPATDKHTKNSDLNGQVLSHDIHGASPTLSTTQALKDTPHHSNEVQDESLLNRLFSQKFRTLRGKMKRTDLAARARFSHQASGHIESGKLPKISTLKKAAFGLELSKAAWLDLLVCWIKAKLGEDSADLTIEPANRAGAHTKSKHTREASELYDQLDSTQQEIILRAMVEKDVIACLPAILHYKQPIKSGAADRSPSNKTEATHSLRCSKRARPRFSRPRLVNNDPWRDL